MVNLKSDKAEEGEPKASKKQETPKKRGRVFGDPMCILEE